MLLTSIAWGLAYADGFSRTLRVSLVFIFVHFIGSSLLVSTVAYFLVQRLFSGKRRNGLFGLEAADERESVEFGYCFDVGRHIGNEQAHTQSTDFTLGINKGLPPHVGVSICNTVPPYAGDCERLLGFIVLRQLIISPRIWVLHNHNFSRI